MPSEKNTSKKSQEHKQSQTKTYLKKYHYLSNYKYETLVLWIPAAYNGLPGAAKIFKKGAGLPPATQANQQPNPITGKKNTNSTQQKTP